MTSPRRTTVSPASLRISVTASMASALTIAIMPMPQLNVRSNSSSAMPPSAASHLNTGSTGSARCDIGARQTRPALCRRDREAGEIGVTVLVEAGHLGGLPADQRAAGFAATLGNAGNNRGGGFRIQLAASEIVQEEQGLGT